METPLLQTHLKYGAKIGEFAGWKTALYFESGLGEAKKTREHATVFDISHMCRIMVKGEEATLFLEKLVTRPIASSPYNRMIGPSAFLNEKGGFKDDVMVYKIQDDFFLIVGNAVNREKNIKWLEKWSENFNVSIEDWTEKTAMLAIQGPKSQRILEEVLSLSLEELEMLEFKTNVKTLQGEVWILSRSGWTGENGYEVIGDPNIITRIWDKLVEKGVQPAGLVARDILRIEMGYCLYGHEITEEITPFEARYKAFSVKKSGYIGYEAVWEKAREGVDKVRYGLVVKGKGPIPREGDKVFIGGVEVGYITSGTFSPTLNTAIAQAYIRPQQAFPGFYYVIILRRGVKVRARLVDFPFIKS